MLQARGVAKVSKPGRSHRSCARCRHAQRRALALVPGTVDGSMTCLCISLMTTQTANMQQQVLGCTRGRSARGRELPWRATAQIFGRRRNRARWVARIAGRDRAGCGRIEILAPRARQPNYQATHRCANGKPAATLPTSERVLLNGLAGIILSIRAFISSIDARCLIAKRCNPDSRSDVHTLLFHLICNSARLMDTPLCRMLFLFSHLLWVMPIAKQLYIQNEGLSEIFQGR